MQPKNEMATKEEIDELLIFIGGLGKWPLLNEDCRREVVKYLDYKSRFNLGICSKDDHETVEKTKISVESVEILDKERLPFLINEKLFDSVTVRIRFPTGNLIQLFFSQLEQDTRIQWLHCIPNLDVVKEIIWKSCDYYEEAVKFAEKWMRKSNFEMEGITIQMAKYPFSTSQIKSLPCCRNVTICADDADSFGWWLKKCPERIDELQLVVYSESFTLPSDFLNAPQIMQALEMSLTKGLTNSSETGASTIRDPEGIIAGLDYVEWDQAFENEHWDFIEDFERFCGLDQCYQIKSKVHPFESLTFSIYDNWVYIYATGKRAERNGEAYTYYRMPYHED
ncbi:unnamed protein product [Caenorhabditis brenneri]